MANNSLLDNAIGKPYDWGGDIEYKIPTPKKGDKPEKTTGGDFEWGESEPIEGDSFMQSAFRAMWQPVSGFASTTVPGLIGDAWEAWGRGEALLAKQEYEDNRGRLKELFPFADFPPIDEEKYMQAIDDATSIIPNVHNIERAVEGQTGLPLQAKTKLQKGLRLAGSAGNLTSGGVANKATAATTAPLVSRGLQEAGVPEGIADAGGLVLGGVGGYLGGKQVAAEATEILSDVKNLTTRGAEKAKNFMKRGGAESLESEVVAGRPPPPPGTPPPSSPGADLPTTKFDTANKILENLSAEENAILEEMMSNQPQEPLGGIRPTDTGKAASSDLPPVTKGGEELGIRVERPPAVKTPEGLKGRIGNKISDSQIYNRNTTGRELQKVVRELDSKAYEEVNNLYDRSRDLNKSVNEIHPELAYKLQDSANEIRKIADPSSVQKRHLISLDKIVDSLATFDESGMITGYKPVTNQAMIEQMQSLRQIVDYDFAHGKPSGIFKPTINSIEDDLIQVSHRTGNASAAESILDAKDAYRDWSTKYDNDYIRPYRDISNRDYAKLFDKTLDTDNFNVMKDLIGDTSEGAQIVKATQREIAEKQLSKVMKDPKNISKPDLEKTYRELETVLDKKQMDGVREEVSDATKRFPNQVRVLKTPEKIPIDMKAIQKYTNKTPEQIEGMVNSRSGIRDLRSDLGKTESGKKLFDKFKQQKIQEILRGEKIKGEFSGDDIYKVMNNKKNYDLIEELTSPQEAKAILDASKEIANRKFTMENIRKIGSKLMKFKVLKAVLSI